MLIVLHGLFVFAAKGVHQVGVMLLFSFECIGDCGVIRLLLRLAACLWLQCCMSQSDYSALWIGCWLIVILFVHACLCFCIIVVVFL